MRFGRESKDKFKIQLHSVQTDPSKFDSEKPWLFHDVIAKFSLSQSKGTPDELRVKDVVSKLNGTSNLFNFQWHPSAKPLAKAVVHALNSTFIQANNL